MSNIVTLMELTTLEREFLETAHNLICRILSARVATGTFVSGIFDKGSASEGIFKYCARKFEKQTGKDFFSWLEIYDAELRDSTLIGLLTLHNNLKLSIN